MKVATNWGAALRTGLCALAVGAVGASSLISTAEAQSVPTPTKNRTRAFNNLSGITIEDPCAGLEDMQDQCPLLTDENTDTPPTPEPSSPFPATIEVPAGAFVAGSKITDVNVTLKGVSHTWLDDVDVLLVGPQGQYVMLMSNVAGSDKDVVNLNFKFDDSARLPLPNSSDNSGRASTRPTVNQGGVAVPNPLYNIIYPEWQNVWTDSAVRSYKPSDYDFSSDIDNFASPAPQNTTTPQVVVTHNATTGIPTVSGGGQLSIFNGTNPVGTWKLFIQDDYFLNGGSVGGWEIEITAAQQ